MIPSCLFKVITHKVNRRHLFVFVGMMLAKGHNFSLLTLNNSNRCLLQIGYIKEKPREKPFSLRPLSQISETAFISLHLSLSENGGSSNLNWKPAFSTRLVGLRNSYHAYHQQKMTSNQPWHFPQIS